MKVLIPAYYWLESTNVTDTTYDTYDSSVTYDENDKVIAPLSVSMPLGVKGYYNSLTDNNKGFFPGSYSTDKISSSTSTTSLTVALGSQSLTIEANKGFTPGMAITIAKTGLALSVSMKAEVVSYDKDTGALVAYVYSMSGTGTSATWTVTSDEEVSFWEVTGVSNAYRMFDDRSSEQTGNLELIEIKFYQTSRVGAIAFFGLQGLSIDIEVWDNDETELKYETTQSIVKPSALSTSTEDVYEYNLGTTQQIEDIVVEFDDVYDNAVIIVKINTATGYFSKCGLCIPGRTITIGKTLYGVETGLLNYSTFDSEDLSVVDGFSSKKSTIPFNIKNTRVDYVYKIIAALNGYKVVWMCGGSSLSYEALVIYGICSDFGISLGDKTISSGSIDIIGTIT